MKFIQFNLHPSLQKAIEDQGFKECTPIQEMALPHILQGRDVAGLAQTGTGKTAAYLVPLIERILQAMEPPASTRRLLSHKEKSISKDEEATSDPPPTTPLSSEDMSPEDSAFTEESSLGEEPHSSKEHQGKDGQDVTWKAVAFKDWKKLEYILILVPTRELAEQVFQNCQVFCQSNSLKSLAIYGGTPYEPQKEALQKGVQFVIATPGRLIDLYKEHSIDLKQVRAVVFDEADRMFDMGFKDDAKYVLRRIPRHRQFLVFSATLNFEVLNMAYQFGSHPIEININRDQAKADHVEDEIFHIGQSEKPKYLLSLLKKHNPRQVIVFSNFKTEIERIVTFLIRNEIPAIGISSLLTQAQRKNVIKQFKSENDQNILVATDVAARGLDIKEVNMVINFDLPEDAENYVHRVGRTGRAGNKGLAFSLVSDRDVESLARVESYLEHKVHAGWMEDTDIIEDFKPYPRGTHLHRSVKKSSSQRSSQKRSVGHRSSQRTQKTAASRDRKTGQDTHRDLRTGRHKEYPKKSQERTKESKDSLRTNIPTHKKIRKGFKEKEGDKKGHKKLNKKGSAGRRKIYQHRSPQKGQKPSTSVSSPPSLAKKVSRFFRGLFS